MTPLTPFRQNGTPSDGNLTSSDFIDSVIENYSMCVLDSKVFSQNVLRKEDRHIAAARTWAR